MGCLVVSMICLLMGGGIITYLYGLDVGSFLSMMLIISIVLLIAAVIFGWCQSSGGARSKRVKISREEIGIRMCIGAVAAGIASWIALMIIMKVRLGFDTETAFVFWFISLSVIILLVTAFCVVVLRITGDEEGTNYYPGGLAYNLSQMAKCIIRIKFASGDSSGATVIEQKYEEELSSLIKVNDITSEEGRKGFCFSMIDKIKNENSLVENVMIIFGDPSEKKIIYAADDVDSLGAEQSKGEKKTSNLTWGIVRNIGKYISSEDLTAFLENQDDIIEDQRKYLAFLIIDAIKREKKAKSAFPFLTWQVSFTFNDESGKKIIYSNASYDRLTFKSGNDERKSDFNDIDDFDPDIDDLNDFDQDFDEFFSDADAYEAGYSDGASNGMAGYGFSGGGSDDSEYQRGYEDGQRRGFGIYWYNNRKK